MKKLILLGLSLALSSTAFAFTETREINIASFTATNETAAWIQLSTGVTPLQNANTAPNTDLRGVIVSTPSVSGTLTLFDSQGASSNKIAVIGLNTLGEYHFNVRLSSGITYTTQSNTGGVTILYHVN